MLRKNNKILVFGNFGYLTNSLDGQTVKTRNIYDILKKNEKIIGEVRFLTIESYFVKRHLL